MLPIFDAEPLRAIAQEPPALVGRHVTIDRTGRESVRAKIRVMVRRVLRKCGYPPDKQEEATQAVFQQTEVLYAEWAA